mgnify:CR=1 FL=1
MFTGIIETLGTVTDLQSEGSGMRLTVSSEISSALKIDQSVAHGGVCLTVVALDAAAGTHTVTAIAETLNCTALSEIAKGDQLNLERCVEVGGRLDGHIVQGHVDCTARVESIESMDGSWLVRISYNPASDRLIVPKGSITVNGVSLTVVDTCLNTGASDPGLPSWFTLALIPYTWEHTTFGQLSAGDAVNLEFDVVGKYVARMLARD